MRLFVRQLEKGTIWQKRHTDYCVGKSWAMLSCPFEKLAVHPRQGIILLTFESLSLGESTTILVILPVVSLAFLALLFFSRSVNVHVHLSNYTDAINCSHTFTAFSEYHIDLWTITSLTLGHLMPHFRNGSSGCLRGWCRRRRGICW